MHHAMRRSEPHPALEGVRGIQCKGPQHVRFQQRLQFGTRKSHATRARAAKMVTRQNMLAKSQALVRILQVEHQVIRCRILEPELEVVLRLPAEVIDAFRVLHPFHDWLGGNGNRGRRLLGEEAGQHVLDGKQHPGKRAQRLNRDARRGCAGGQGHDQEQNQPGGP